MTAFDVAQRFVGVTEAPGVADNPMVVAMLRLDNKWPAGDSVPWCSAFVNFVAWLCRLPRSKDLRARSWLTVGHSIGLTQAIPGSDVVILRRGKGDQPGPDVINAPGHVGFFAGLESGRVLVLGGNQGDKVSVAPYPIESVLGVRRLA